MATLTAPRLKFISRPYRRRIGLIPVSVTLAASWLLVGLVLSLAVSYIKYALFWGAFVILSVFALVLYLCFLTDNLIHAGRLRYELELDGDSLFLSSYDKTLDRRDFRSLSLTEVKRAEYQPRDIATLVLYSKAMKLEIPLWSFGPVAGDKIVNYVRSRGVAVVAL